MGEHVNKRSVLLRIEAKLIVILVIAWKEKLNATSAIKGNAQGEIKLRINSQFEHEYGTEPKNNYSQMLQVSLYCGVAPIKIETLEIW